MDECESMTNQPKPVAELSHPVKYVAKALEQGSVNRRSRFYHTVRTPDHTLMTQSLVNITTCTHPIHQPEIQTLTTITGPNGPFLKHERSHILVFERAAYTPGIWTAHHFVRWLSHPKKHQLLRIATKGSQALEYSKLTTFSTTISIAQPIVTNDMTTMSQRKFQKHKTPCRCRCSTKFPSGWSDLRLQHTVDV